MTRPEARSARPPVPWGGLVSLAIYLLFLAVALLLIGIGVSRGADALRLSTGTVALVTGSVEARFADDHSIWYTFRPGTDASEIAGMVKLSTDEWAALHVGSPIPVDYLVSDPTTNWPVGHPLVPEDVESAVAGVAIGLLVLVVASARYRPRGLRSALRAARAGSG
jgi:hypothetical protein